MKKFVVKLVKIKEQFVRKLRVYTERERFGFELGVLESVSSWPTFSMYEQPKYPNHYWIYISSTSLPWLSLL
jgi:hypothetical protein